MSGRRQDAVAGWSAPGYEALRELLRSRTGLTFAPNRYAQAELGIRRAMAGAGIADLDQYVERVQSGAVDLDDLVSELTVGETYFFRHQEMFDVVRDKVLRQLVRAQHLGHRLRVWSAGCASGEEAYSLAILFEEEEMSEGASVLGTDISRVALTKAHAATYTEWSLRGTEERLVDRYFERRGDRFVLNDRVRERVAFEYLNLALDCFPSFAKHAFGMDLIFCRNVLIYFDGETTASVARRFFEALAPGGWLITAPTDPPLAPFAPFEAVVTDAGILYRREVVGTTPPPRAWGAPHSPTRTDADEPTPLAARPSPMPVDGLLPAHACASDGSSGGRGHVAAAVSALVRGDRHPVVELLRENRNDEHACTLSVRALANLDTGEAERACAAATADHPLSLELHYLHAVLLLELGRLEEAAARARRALYLDRTLAVAHLVLGSILRSRGDLGGAARAYRNARDLCLGAPRDEVLPLSDGERAGRLAEIAAVQLALLEGSRESVA